MLAPERRTRADLLAAVAIAVVVVIAMVVVWCISDARGTVSEPATHAAEQPAAAEELPVALRELWHAPDGAAARALTAGGVAVAGDGGTVTGYDPVSGKQVWKYQRDMPLCGVEAQYGTVIGTYRDQRGCSQTTMLSADTGARRTARSSYMDRAITLTADGTYFLAQGSDRLEVWRSDLVRTLEYGYVDAPVNVKTQPRSGCTLLSSISGSTRLAVLEHCPGDGADRLSVLNPAPKDATTPEEYGSHVLTEPGGNVDGARVLAVSDNRVLLYLPGTGTTTPELAIFDGTANLLSTDRLNAPLPPTATTTRIGSAYLIYSGNSVIALNASTFDPLWTAPDALGSPALMAGQILIPVDGAIAALNSDTGAETTRIPVRRSDYHNGPISLAVVGSTILEQRGGRIYGLGR
ncbi:Rv3212 family protein [Nocardia macrotermitis]|uniref:Rv3212 family protein n=1 Tax=Nocardia macrotermitis TaxID=2585198 RepID=UPI0029E7D7A4|nr:PQQ-binding-like beta-propeller repeat protein [Nocardia macrotermitis]